MLKVTKKEGGLDEQERSEGVEVDGGEGEKPGFSLMMKILTKDYQPQQNYKTPNLKSKVCDEIKKFIQKPEFQTPSLLHASKDQM